jgi:hypothetical protein
MKKDIDDMSTHNVLIILAEKLKIRYCVDKSVFGGVIADISNTGDYVNFEFSGCAFEDKNTIAEFFIKKYDIEVYAGELYKDDFTACFVAEIDSEIVEQNYYYPYFGQCLIRFLIDFIK